MTDLAFFLCWPEQRATGAVDAREEVGMSCAGWESLRSAGTV